MDEIKLNASDLPVLSGVIKDLINWGKWQLYKVTLVGNPDIQYSLQNENGEYLLDKDGNPISVVSVGMNGLNYIGKCSFDGIPMPPKINLSFYETV